MSEATAKVTAKDGVFVRSEATTDSKRLGTLVKGTTFTYYSNNNGWLQIYYKNRNAYVCGKYTNASSNAASAAPQTAETKNQQEAAQPQNQPETAQSGASSAQSKTMYVKINYINVREKVGTSSKILGKYNQGEPVTVIDKAKGTWLKISYNGGEAYVDGKNLQDTPVETKTTSTQDNTQTENHFEPRTTKVVCNGKLSVRKEPKKSKEITKLKHDTVVTYDAEIGEWLHITDPVEGYIKLEFTRHAIENGDPNAVNDTGNFKDSDVEGDGTLRALTTKEVAKIESSRKAKNIIDLQTRKTFTVSWGACKNGYHSDCTPMTPNDTTVVKSILHPNVDPDKKSYWSNPDNWSWKGRPAAIKLKDGKYVACGYHLRPHGSRMPGTNPGHPFTGQSNEHVTGTDWGAVGGHFCLYYGDSDGGTQECNKAAKQAQKMSL